MVFWYISLLTPPSRFNAALGAVRRQGLNGIYDPHTNTMQYPKTMQPTHARWEQIDDHEINTEPDENMKGEDGEPTSIFTHVKPLYSKNFMIVDTAYESASANLGVPGPDGDVFDIGFNGLSTVPDHIKAELPLDCLKAFEGALKKEREWKRKWGAESQFGHRKAPAIDKGVV